MKKVYGNHVGIVISNKDPENRGRCQIFIPHLSNTTFKGWNEKLSDIEFTNVGSIPPSVLERLRQVLPWAEYAAPLFGGGTGAPKNESTGVITTNPKAGVVSESDIPIPASSGGDDEDVIPLPPVGGQPSSKTE
jgi:hypothetical protein